MIEKTDCFGLCPCLPTGRLAMTAKSLMLKQKADNTIRLNNLIKARDKIVVGVSGGPDSIALLNYLSNPDFIPHINVYAAHLNHMIRGGESVKDERFVREFCKKREISCFIKKADIPAYAKRKKISLEEAGRNCRYEFFNDVMAKTKADKIALAHTADDNVETFLMRLIRGSGIKGLCSISPTRGKIIRPFMDVWKSDVIKYCKNNNLMYRLDRSNLEDKYLRNKIRNKLIPHLKKYNPQVKEAIISTIKTLSDDYGFISQETKKAFKKIAEKKGGNALILNRSKLLRLPASIQNHVLRIAIETIKGNLKNISFLHLSDILKLKRGGINLPDNIIIKRERDHIIISNEPSRRNKNKSFCCKLKMPGATVIDEIGRTIRAKKVKFIPKYKDIKKNIAYIDEKKLAGGLIVRNFKKGNYFVPLGMSGRKKLHDFFIDEKIPQDERTNIPIIADEKKIIWIAGHRLSDEVKIDQDTKKVIRLSVACLPVRQARLETS